MKYIMFCFYIDNNPISNYRLNMIKSPLLWSANPLNTII